MGSLSLTQAGKGKTLARGNSLKGEPAFSGAITWQNVKGHPVCSNAFN
jgi:hypothetical protein